MKKRILLITILALLLTLAASATLAFAGRSAAQTPSGLEGVRWVLVSYSDGGGTVAALAATPATAEFAAAKVSGSTGCNTYNAPYQATGNTLTVGLTATTMMACSPAIMDQEAAYLKNLQAAATFKIDGSQLTIAGADGKVLLTFQAEKPGGLTSGAWVMTNYNNGRGGFQSAMAGVAVTALFDAKGQLSGNGGCNTYNATYQVDGDNIKIGPAMSTKMACEQAIMDQEMAYLNALSKVATYKIEGNKLTMRDASGASMVAYTQAPAPTAPAPAATAPAPATGTGAAATAPAPATGAGAAATAPAPATGTGAAAPAGKAKTEGIYLTLRPAADASVQTVVLSLEAGGVAKFAQDFGKEQTIVESGTWTEADNTVTVNLTDKDGATLATPIAMKFVHDGTFLTLVDYDKAVWGESGLKLNKASNIAQRLRSAMVTIDLSAGFPLDPTFVSVNGGGEVDASVLSRSCKGFINRQPVVTVKWAGQADRARVFFYSDGDPTLMVMTPKGELLCNDNASPQLLDPFIEIANPVAGDYKIWVGSAEKEEFIPGVLVLTKKSDLDLGTFNLGNLISRPSIPQTAVEASAAVELAPQVLALTERLLQSAPTLNAGARVKAAPIDITAQGDVPLFRLPNAAGKGCAGLVTGAPSYAFKWTGKTDNLHVAFEGDGDSTLMVVGLGAKQVWCNDDASADTLNPAIDIESPADDTYLVYVGRTSPKQPVVGKLTVAEAAKEQ